MVGMYAPRIAEHENAFSNCERVEYDKFALHIFDRPVYFNLRQKLKDMNSNFNSMILICAITCLGI